MPRTPERPKDASFNLRDGDKRRERAAFEAEAHRQSLEVAKAALDPTTDEWQVMRELEAELADPAYLAGGVARLGLLAFLGVPALTLQFPSPSPHVWGEGRGEGRLHAPCNRTRPSP